MTQTHEDIINNTITLLRSGWHKGAYQKVSLKGEVSYCALGALMESAGVPFNAGLRWNDPMISTIYRNLSKKCKAVVGYYSISIYNDCYAESVGDIITIYEKVRAEVGPDGMLPNEEW